MIKQIAKELFKITLQLQIRSVELPPVSENRPGVIQFPLSKVVNWVAILVDKRGRVGATLH